MKLGFLQLFSRNSSKAITKSDLAEQPTSLKKGNAHNRTMPLAVTYPSPPPELNITLPSSSLAQVSRWVPQEEYRADVHSHYQKRGKEAWKTIEKLNHALDAGKSEQCIIKILNKLDSFHPNCPREKSGGTFPNAIAMNGLSVQNLNLNSLNDDEEILTQLSRKIQKYSKIKNVCLNDLKWIRKESKKDQYSIYLYDIQTIIGGLQNELKYFFKNPKYQPVERDLIKLHEALENPREDHKQVLTELVQFCNIFIRRLKETY